MLAGGFYGHTGNCARAEKIRRAYRLGRLKTEMARFAVNLNTAIAIAR